MTEQHEQEKLRSYLAAQSTKLSAVEIRQRLDEAAREFFKTIEGITDATAHRPPAPAEWTVAEVVDHVTLTLADATEIMKALAGGKLAQPFREHRPRPAQAAEPIAEVVSRLRRSQAAVTDFLDAQTGEPHLELRVSESFFGNVNWKAYALILRLHYKDHTRQVKQILAGVSGLPGSVAAT